VKCDICDFNKVSQVFKDYQEYYNKMYK
jgi:hypothetical protein